MSEIPEAPLESDVWFNKGVPTWNAYNFFSKVSDLFAIIGQGIFKYQRYADLNDVDTIIKNPVDGFTVMFEGQGLGTYNEAASEWRLSADDTTPIS